MKSNNLRSGKLLKLKHKARHVAVIGRSGAGKTAGLVELARDAQYARVFIFDPEDEFSRRLERPFVTGSLADMLATKSRVTCYVPGDYDNDGEAFEDFCLFCHEFAKRAEGPTLMIVDEIQMYASTHVIGEQFLDSLIRGRKKGLDIAFATHQANMLHNFIRPQTSEVYALGVADDSCTKFLKSFGVPVEELLDLPDLHYLHKLPGCAVEKGVFTV